MTSPELPRIRLEIQLDEGATLKSLESLVWDNVPGFVVLTGPNGSGKTQLLMLLAYKLAQIDQSPLGGLRNVRVSITGDAIGPDAIVYVPSSWQLGGGGTATIEEMATVRQNFWNRFQRQNTNHDPNLQGRRMRLAKRLGLEDLNQIGQHDFSTRLPDDFSYLLDERDITAGIAQVFFGYRLRLASELVSGLSNQSARAKLGPAPWDLMNQVFAEAEFPFRVRSPPHTDLLQPIDFRLHAVNSDIDLQPTELSSGEQVILGVVSWLYQSNNFGGFPKLLLVDEPDAHLHPTMARQLIDVLYNVLVKQHGVRVILTTHSPSTVALSPDGSIFEMRRWDATATTPRITPAISKANAVARLTAGLVVVSPGARQVLVEDEDDVAFYEAVRDLLTDYGPGKDPRAIAATPPLTLIAASRGKGKDKVGGGCTIVKQWVDKLDQPPFLEVVRGVIDRDAGNAATARIKVIGRHSIENYLTDPLVVFVALIDLGQAPPIDGAGNTPGTEHRIRDYGPAVLQRIVDAICERISERLGTLRSDESHPEVVRFTNGVELSYPAWVFYRRGHDLLSATQAAYGGPSGLTPPRLLKSFQRLRMIPNELATLLGELQT